MKQRIPSLPAYIELMRNPIPAIDKFFAQFDSTQAQTLGPLDVKQQGQSILMLCTSSNKVASVQYCQTKLEAYYGDKLTKEKINQDCDRLGLTPLFIAAKSNQPGMVTALCELGFDPNYQVSGRVTSVGKTPLHVAVTSENCGVSIPELLKNGANPSLSDTDENTPLHLACQSNRKAVETLLDEINKDGKYKIDDLINQLNHQQQTPLDLVNKKIEDISTKLNLARSFTVAPSSEDGQSHSHPRNRVESEHLKDKTDMEMLLGIHGKEHYIESCEKSIESCKASAEMLLKMGAHTGAQVRLRTHSNDSLGTTHETGSTFDDEPESPSVNSKS